MNVLGARQQGFTLIEVVVSFSILALSLGAIYESFSMSLRQLRHAADRGYATLLAESIRDRAGVDLSLQRDSEGQANGCSWHLTAKPMERPQSDQPMLLAYQASVSTHCGESGGGAEARLDFLELVPAK